MGYDFDLSFTPAKINMYTSQIQGDLSSQPLVRLSDLQKYASTIVSWKKNAQFRFRSCVRVNEIFETDIVLSLGKNVSMIHIFSLTSYCDT